MTIKIPLSILKYIADRQTEFQTAWNIYQYVFPIVTFETFAMLACEKFGIYGNAAILIYIIIPIIGFIGVVISGRVLIRSDYQYLFMKNSADLNKDWKEVVTILRELKERK
ncbi:MAG: hypothetical protein WCX79_00540 [Candidatus Paceibacterota bacterium]|jgi:hypothetical protein